MSARTTRVTRAQLWDAIERFRDALSTAYDQNNALHAAVAALLPSPAHPLLAHRQDDPDEVARTALGHALNHARVLLEHTLSQVTFDLDCATASLLSEIVMYAEQTVTLDEVPA